MLIDNFTYCISQLDKCIRAATCEVCVQPHSFVSADSCCGSFGEVKTLFCLETKAYLDEGEREEKTENSYLSLFFLNYDLGL